MRPPLCYSPMPIRHLISEQGTRVTVTVAGAFSLLVPTQFRYECVAAIVRGHPLNAIRQMRGPPMFAEDKMRRLAPVECKRASIRERDAAVGACVHSRHAMIERESMSAERRAAQRSLLVAHDRVDRAVCLASHERILRAVRKEALGQPRGIGHVHLAVPPVARPQCEWGRAALADACCLYLADHRSESPQEANKSICSVDRRHSATAAVGAKSGEITRKDGGMAAPHRHSGPGRVTRCGHHPHRPASLPLRRRSPAREDRPCIAWMTPHTRASSRGCYGTRLLSSCARRPSVRAGPPSDVSRSLDDAWKIHRRDPPSHTIHMRPALACASVARAQPE